MTRPSRLAAPLLAVALLLAGCASGSDDDIAAAPSSADEVVPADTDLAPCPDQPDQPAADSDVSDLRFDCFNGGSLDFAKAPGVPTVVNLWASWCGPCREELPIVQQLADASGDQLRVLTVNSQDRVSAATSFAADAGITIPTAVDASGDLAAGLGLRGLPYTLFLAADGSVAYVQRVPVDSLAEFEQLVAEHLGVQL
ncbi:Thiol-disulfide isomerase or thioredoxin [Modestobacter sp. DSM 44400]|uniref:TlpA family protein disulfide reductase n=1 Tax=Modestobacter sp. DSM 44400 TaxID=1550230 RepID=UPI00089638FD|nr:TlpA disulfide reductase family protein [Modestobacter sp. DSM 44400]SDY16676.1 Thiol-disulfide isomerase or thioredoxin [Modestobacter sp. DSM 44400]